MDDKALFDALLEVNNSIAALREEVRVGFAALPSVYVSQRSVNEARREALVAKRFAFTSAIMSVGALGTFIGLLVG